MDDPGFESPAGPPPSTGSSSDAPSDGRRTCASCPRRMSTKTYDIHTVCVACRGRDCDFANRCEECVEWTDEEIGAYVKHRKRLRGKSKSTTSAPPPPATPPPSSPAAPAAPPPPDPLAVRVDGLV